MSSETKSNQPQNALNQQLHRVILPNGIILLIVENQAADLVAGRFFFSNTGSIVEGTTQTGISNLVSSVITKGTRNLSALEIAEQVESTGASLGADAGTDYFAFSLKTVSADFPAILKLLGEIIRFPTFPPAEVELERKIALQTIRSQKEQPFNVAFEQLRQNIYGKHPYGVSVLGTEETVAKLTPEDLTQYHQTYFRPDHLIISLSGCLAKQTAIDLIAEVFGDWQIPSSTLVVNELPNLETQPSEKVIFQDTQQSIVMLGYVGTGVINEAYPVLKLLSTYLGNGLSSRLFVELREKRGLAYDVSAFYPTRLEPAPFVVYMGTAPENTEIALNGLSQEVERLSEVKLSDEELQGAKNKLLGQYALGKQTNGEIAQIYGWYEALGLGVDFDLKFPEAISQVTPEISQQVARAYLKNPFISIVQPENK
jgi:zinc protease